MGTGACARRALAVGEWSFGVSDMKKIIKPILASVVLIYAAIAAFLYVKQRDLIYYPQPAATNIVESKYSLINGGIALKGWVLNTGKRAAILYFGGNAERVEANIPVFKQIFKGHTVYLVAYRGYGESEGAPSEAALFSDAEAIYDDIKKKHESISIIGRSLSSGIATYLSSMRDVDKLVLITPYDSIENVAQAAYPIFPISVLLKDKYRSVNYAVGVKSKTLILVAERDEVISRKSSDNLAKGFNPEKLKVRIIGGATHRSISTSNEYLYTLLEFLK